MPLFREYVVGSARIAVWKITETAEELSSLVASESAAEAILLRGEQRRREWLAVRALLPLLCGDGARIVYDANGKPLLENAEGFISISHTRGYALLAHSADVPFGVDVELADRSVSAVSSRFMDRADVGQLYPHEAEKAMLQRWCVCEALFKLVGDVGGTYKDNIFMPLPFPAGGGELNVSLRECSGHPDSEYVAHCVEDEGLLVVALFAKGV